MATDREQTFHASPLDGQECYGEAVGGKCAICGAETERTWGRDDWSSASVDEMRARLDEIGPPWGNPRLLARPVAEGFWIAYEALDRLERPS